MYSCERMCRACPGQPFPIDAIDFSTTEVTCARTKLSTYITHCQEFILLRRVKVNLQ